MYESFYYDANVKVAKEKREREREGEREREREIDSVGKRWRNPGAIRFSFQFAFKVKTLKTNRG